VAVEVLQVQLVPLVQVVPQAPPGHLALPELPDSQVHLVLMDRLVLMETLETRDFLDPRAQLAVLVDLVKMDPLD